MTFTKTGTQQCPALPLYEAFRDCGRHVSPNRRLPPPTCDFVLNLHPVGLRRRKSTQVLLFMRLQVFQWRAPEILKHAPFSVMLIF